MMPLCACGCGEPVRISQVSGEPNIYIHNHHPHPRKSWDDYPEPVLDPVTGCLRWQGTHASTGYGMIGKQYAHRVAYERVHGALDPGLEVDHVYERGCRFKDCVNVDHLDAVDHTENMRRWSETFTHCPQGHEYTITASGRKRCLVCHRDRERRRQAQKSCV